MRLTALGALASASTFLSAAVGAAPATMVLLDEARRRRR